MPFMFTVTYVGESGDGKTYGPYDRADPLAAMLSYMSDPDAGWVRANDISQWRVEDDEQSTVFSVESRETYQIIRDESGNVLMSRGNVPEGVS